MHEQSFNFIIRSLRTAWRLCEFIVIGFFCCLPGNEWRGYELDAGRIGQFNFRRGSMAWNLCVFLEWDRYSVGNSLAPSW